MWKALARRGKNPIILRCRVLDLEKTRSKTVRSTMPLAHCRINRRRKTLDLDNNLIISILKMVTRTKQRNLLISFYHNSPRRANAIRPRQLQPWRMEEEKPISVLSLVFNLMDESRLLYQTVWQIWNSQIIALHKKMMEHKKRLFSKMVKKMMKKLLDIR